MGHEPLLNIQQGRRLLFDVVDVLDQHQIPYHLEGGTLLGLVRDGDLLPWDHDLDISIPAEDIHRFDFWCKTKLRFKFWRISTRHFTADGEAHGWLKNDLRIFKIAQRKNIIQRGWPQLDLFVKYSHAGRVWWAAKNKVMCVSDHHYKGFETLVYRGRTFKIPVDHQAYLTAKYGDWSQPVQDWDCGTDEKTIAGVLKG